MPDVDRSRDLRENRNLQDDSVIMVLLNKREWELNRVNC